MIPNKTLEMAAAALCEHRREDPTGMATLYRYREGKSVLTVNKSYLDIAREEARAVLDAAVPGLLTGQVVVQPADMEQFG